MRKTRKPQDHRTARANQAKKTEPDRLFVHGLESRQLLSAAANVIVSPNLALEHESAAYVAANGYSPAQIRAAYGFNSVSFTSGSSTVAGLGQGQTIAIVDAYSDPNIAHDLSVFDSAYGLASPPSLKVVNQTGGSALPATNAGWAGEISLDVEWAHAIAPDANILLVESSSATLGSLLAGVNYARNASGVSVVSMSWGGSEFSGETAYDSYFTTPAGHQGVTFVAASGDSGPANGPEWPAVSPNVVSVGGTSLTLANSSGTYGSESAWIDSTGGTSQLESEPSYQSGIPSTYTSTAVFNYRGGYSITSNRSAPDVAYDADPNTGFAVYDSLPDQGYSGWQEIGGTSAGAPQWSALIAIADQGRELKGLSSLNGASQTLPALYGVYSNSGTAGYASYAAKFNDITTGGPWYDPAAAGYDGITGLGSPKAAQVISTLTTSGSASTAVKTVATTTTASRVRASVARQDVAQSIPPALAQAAQRVGLDSFLSGSPLQAWTGVEERFSLADTAPTVIERAVGLTNGVGNMALALGRIGQSASATDVGIRSTGTAALPADVLKNAVAAGLPGTDVIASVFNSTGGGVSSKLGSLFSKSPIGGLTLPDVASLPGTLLRLSPAVTVQQLESQAWEFTAAACLGATVAGCAYLHASRREEEEAKKSESLRLRRVGPGWELKMMEER